jgi:hypothetical protein
LLITPDSAINGLRLVLEKDGRNFRVGDAARLSLVLLDAYDTEMMRFALPASVVDDIRGDITDLEIFMSLDGSLSIVAPDSERALSSVRLGLNQLVSRDLSPEMLEDEPNAVDQIQVLRQHLKDALAIVDRTLADLNKPDS